MYRRRTALALIVTGFFVACLSMLSAGETTAGSFSPELAQVNATQVVIGESGIDPKVVTVTVGSSIVWENRTSVTQHLRSGSPFPIYLPAVKVATVSGNTSARSNTPNARAQIGIAYNADIQPFGVYTQPFSTPGEYPYYLFSRPHEPATVVVTGENGLPPDPSTVAPPLDEGVAGGLSQGVAFLYSGTNPIQTGVTVEALAITRTAVLRGFVFDVDGGPLPDVTIAILNYPEFGQTVSRADGGFDMVVNGGGMLTVTYSRQGYLPAHRQVTPAWQQFTLLPDVVLLQLDPAVTTVNLDGATGFQIARGSVISDTDGQRRATLLVPAGVSAELVLADGTRQPLAAINVRATEYTVGEPGEQAMPAQLPAQSGYTYALEYSVDEAFAAGASDVRFSQPLIHYVENFLNFPVGMAVPTGYYDRQLARWIPAANGRVIRILTVDNGMANLDTDGDEQIDAPALLQQLGITDAERQQLAALYPAGATLWRVPIDHFTPWDCNWPYGPPPDAGAPPPGSSTPSSPPDKDCEQGGGSVIGCQAQALMETVELVGTTFALHYRSDRSPGYNPRLLIPLSGSSLPPSAKRIELVVTVAGRRFQDSFPANPNQTFEFLWDGRDVYGRMVPGTQEAAVRVGYVYDAVYYEPSEFAQSFSTVSGQPLEKNQARREITVWTDWVQSISRAGFAASQIGGWSPSVHHAYDVLGQTLYKGDGTKRQVQARETVLATAAGNGRMGGAPFEGDGGPATAARLGEPRAVETGPDGTVYLADQGSFQVRRIAPDGTIHTVAGSGATTPEGYADGSPATEAALDNPTAIALAPDGDLYIAAGKTLHRVTPDGKIYLVAGSRFWTGAGAGNGEAAPAARFGNISGIAVGPDGEIYLADNLDHTVRRIGADGIIQPFAGQNLGFPSPGFSGDGGPAAQAKLNGPSGLAIGPDGSLYIADTSNNRLRRIYPNGIIQTVAGNGLFSGSTGPMATEIALSNVFDVAVNPQGILFLSTTSRIYRVEVDGSITVVVGDGSRSYLTEGGPATGTGLSPDGLALDPAGLLYIGTSDYFAPRIYRLVPAFPGLQSGELTLPSEDGGQLFVFAANGRHLRTLHALTGATLYQFGYTESGRLITITDGFGQTTRIERTVEGLPAAIVPPSGPSTSLSTDAHGYLASITNPAGERWSFSLNRDGLMLSEVDPIGQEHRFTYDTAGRLVTDQTPMGNTFELTRTVDSGTFTVTLTNGLSQTRAFITEKDPAGQRHNLVREASGATTRSSEGADGAFEVSHPDGTRVLARLGPHPTWGMQVAQVMTQTVTTPGGQRSVWDNRMQVELGDPDDLLSVTAVTRTVEINGKAYQQLYHAENRTFTTTSPAGRIQSIGMTPQGSATRVQRDSSLPPLLFTYDSAGRLIQLNQGPATVDYGRDEQGRVATISREGGTTVVYGYDQADRVTNINLSSGRTYTYTYDARGQMIGVTNPLGASHAMGYTAMGQLSAYTPPNADPGYQMAYDVTGKPTVVTFPSQRTLTYERDSFGRLTGLLLTDERMTFGYQDSAQAISTYGRGARTGAPVQQFSLSRDGMLITGMQVTGHGAADYTYDYDNNFQLAELSMVSNGQSWSVPFEWDADGLVTRYGPFAIDRGGPAGAISRLEDESVALAVEYDALGRLAHKSFTVGGQVHASLSISFSHSGLVTGRTVHLSGENRNHSYTYDLDGQLLTAQEDGELRESYAYDRNGNRTWRQVAPLPEEIARYDLADRLVEQGGIQVQNDLDGYLVARGTDTFRYSVRGELLEASVSGNTVTYTYDALGRRVSRSDSNGTSEYLYARPTDYVVTASRATDGALSVYYYDDVGLLFALDRDGQRYYVLSDQVGTPVAVLDKIGTLVKSIQYDSFGTLLSDSNPAFDLPIGYGGGLADAVTGLVRLGVREYDPVAGRWTALDPALFDGDLYNLYSFAGNNPVSRQDPGGLVSFGAGYYTGLGGGFKLSIDGTGFSFCAEAGFGIGQSVDVSPYSGLDKDFGGTTFDVSLQAAGFGYGASRDVPAELFGPCAGIPQWDKARDSYKARIPFMEMDLSSEGAAGQPLDAKGLSTGFGVKVASKQCIQHLW